MSHVLPWSWRVDELVALDAIATNLDHLVAAEGVPLVVGVVPASGHVEFHLHPLDGHPCDQLCGFLAPDDWWAAGVAVLGHSRRLPGPTPADGEPVGRAERRPVRLVHLRTRVGDTCSLLTPEGSDPLVMLHGVGGLIDDIVRRVLQLPTPAPPTPLELWSRVWLMEVLDLLTEAPGDASWDVVAALHPAVAQVRRFDPGAVDPPGEHLVGLGIALATAFGWEALRERWSGAGGAPSDGVDAVGRSFGLTPDEVAWMDAGALARWCLAELPELVELVDAVLALARPTVCERLAAALADWGVPSAIWDAPDPLEPG